MAPAYGYVPSEDSKASSLPPSVLKSPGSVTPNNARSVQDLRRDDGLTAAMIGTGTVRGANNILPSFLIRDAVQESEASPSSGSSSESSSYYSLPRDPMDISFDNVRSVNLRMNKMRIGPSGGGGPDPYDQAEVERYAYIENLLKKIRGTATKRKGKPYRNTYQEALQAQRLQQLTSLHRRQYYDDLAYTRHITHDAVHTQSHSIRYGF